MHGKKMGWRKRGIKKMGWIKWGEENGMRKFQSFSLLMKAGGIPLPIPLPIPLFIPLSLSIPFSISIPFSVQPSISIPLFLHPFLKFFFNPFIKISLSLSLSFSLSLSLSHSDYIPIKQSCTHERIIYQTIMHAHEWFMEKMFEDSILELDVKPNTIVDALL